MAYSRSVHRSDFEQRIAGYLNSARRVSGKHFDTDIQNMVYQCAILLTGAATETYLRLLLEDWMQRLSQSSLASALPHNARAYITLQRLQTTFAKFGYTGDEKEVFASLHREKDLWDFIKGSSAIPSYVNGKAVHDKSSYPSERNMTRLFSRIGIPNIIGLLSGQLKRDASLMIEGFQSVRTAAAHAHPQPLTVLDVKRLLEESKQLVGAIDRIMHSHVSRHGGNLCWPR